MLRPGAYVLICNRNGHYAVGMATPFAVTGNERRRETVLPRDDLVQPRRHYTDKPLSAGYEVVVSLSDFPVVAAIGGSR